MPDIVAPAVERYLSSLVRKRNPVLKQMEALARKIRYPVGGGRTIDFPIVGPVVGALLAQQARMAGARRVFELGSGYGYSALWFAEAVGADGKVTCTEGREDNRRLAEGFFRKAGLAARLDFRVGDGLEILRREKMIYDVIFVDMEKTRYPLALAAALPRLRKGGLLIADNVLWSGAVARPGGDAATRALRLFTKKLLASPALSTVVLPLRDGVSVSLKR